MEVCGLISKTR